MKIVKNILSEKEMELVPFLMTDCKSTGDIQDKLKRLFAGTIEQIIEEEMDEHLGYEKNSIAGNNSGNSRNSYGKKTIASDYGECEIAVPHNRNSEFEPQIIAKRQTRTDEIKNRGVKDIFIACHDNLTGLSEAVNSIFPKTKNQLCIVHQIRNSYKFVPYKDRKTVCSDLKKIYVAVNLDDAEYAKEEFREKWDKKYPNILKSWGKNWSELTTFFEYPAEIRKIIYTTNAVEGYHRMVRKFTKSKSIFTTDDSIRKVIYMSIKEISKKWTMPVRDWELAYAQFAVYFEDRLAA